MKKIVTTGILSAALLSAGVAGVCLTSGSCAAETKQAASQAASQKTGLKEQANEIQWFTSLDAAITESKKTGKPIMADFYADWCPPCQLMKNGTFPDAKVIAESQNWVMLKVDTEKQPELAARYRISSLPTMAVLNSEGKPVTGAMGYLSAADLVKMMRETHGQATQE